MSKDEKEFQIRPSVTPNFGRDTLLATPVVSLMRQSEVTTQERGIAKQLRIYTAEQTAVTVRGDYGAQLISNFSSRTYDRIEEFVDLSREIRDKERHPDDQAVMAKVCNHLLESEINTQLALRQGVVNEIGRICTEPFEHEVDQREEVIIEQTPGFFGRLFGGQTVTKVLR